MAVTVFDLSTVRASGIVGPRPEPEPEPDQPTVWEDILRFIERWEVHLLVNPVDLDRFRAAVEANPETRDRVRFHTSDAVKPGTAIRFPPWRATP